MTIMSSIHAVQLKSTVREIWTKFPDSSAAEVDFLYNLALLMAGSAVVVLILLQFLKSPYGRYGSPKIIGLHPKVAWILQELPSFAVPVVLMMYATSNSIQCTTNRVLIAMFLLHYFQRTFIFPMLLRGAKETPLGTMLLALVFCLYNGYLQGRTLTQYAVYQEDWLYSPTFILGCASFFIGMAINIHSDHILRNLRKPGETGYKIPKGGLFDYVSGANFFGETLEWLGWAIACNTVQGYAFFMFTICNVGPRAVHHHSFYKKKFEDYPKDRKAFIPFVL